MECTGSPSGLADALRLARPRGRVVLKSTYAGAPQVDVSRIVVDEIQVLGSRCGPFEPALRLLERGAIDVRSMIDATISLDQGERAFERAEQKGTLKVLVRP
mgnify:CR=1 FL=1